LLPQHTSKTFKIQTIKLNLLLIKTKVMKKFTLLTFTLLFAATFITNTVFSQTPKENNDAVPVANLGELLEMDFSDNTTVYQITGEVVLTYQQDFRNQKYIQDDHGAILIDDRTTGNFDPGIILTEYDLYDGITGLTGTISIFGNMRQFVPVEDPGNATSEDNEIIPLEISLTEFVDNFMDYQSMLVKVLNVSFVNPTGNFANGQVYDITDGDVTALFRTTFFGEDYIGTPIPGGPFNITGLPNSRAEGDYLSARFLSDFEPLASYEITFNVIDENDDPVTDAVITLGNQTNNTGDYLFEDVPGGSHPFTVVKEGYFTREGMVAVSEDATITVILVEVSANLVTEFPWAEDFEEEVFPPANWSHYAYGAGGWASTTTAHTGQRAVYHNFTTNDANSWLVSPQIQLPEDESMLLKFFQRNNFMNDYDYSAVKISTGSGNPAQDEFVQVYESSSAVSNYSERIVNLSDYAGKVVYFAFVYEGNDAHQWYIDDVTIEEAPAAVEVDNIAALYDAEVGDLIYQVTGEVFITHQQQAYRGQMYIQDGSAAIMIDDPAAIITTDYNNYDGLINIKGTLSVFQEMLQFVPTEDFGAPNSTGNTVEPMEVTLAELNEEIQGMLVLVRNVSFDFDHENFPADHTFTHNQSYYILDATGTGEIRTPNSPDLLDYFGTDIPTTPKDIVGVLHQRFEVTRLQPRSLTDFMEPTSIQEIEAAGFNMYPNPAVTQFTISGEQNVDYVRVYNLSGQMLMHKPVNSNHTIIDVDTLNTGVYIVQVIYGNKSVNYKLQVQR
jgi:hypothetical protein